MGGEIFMISRVIYSNGLDRCIKENYNIPYRLHQKARYRNKCWYWLEHERDVFKVEEVLYEFDGPAPTLNHVILRSSNGYMSWICTDLTTYDFFIERDIYNIRNQKIINSNKSFSGGEIEYWFFMNEISLNSNKYKNFAKYLNPRSCYKLEPFKYYYICARESKGSYRNIEFIVDPNKVKFKEKRR